MDKFDLYRKWFWIGIVMALFNVIGGLVYGIAVFVDKEHRKEGAIIIVFALAWFFFVLYVIGPWLAPWLIKSGYIQGYKFPTVQ